MKSKIDADALKVLHTREPQYQRTLEIAAEKGLTTLGLMTNGRRENSRSNQFSRPLKKYAHMTSGPKISANAVNPNVSA